MKTLFRLLTLLMLATAFSGCLEEKCESEIEYILYEPVYLEAADFRVTIEADDPKDLCTPAGFYVYGDYLLIVEHDKGLHIMDNSNPVTPAPVSFLPVEGAVGLAVRNDILYINNYVDLLTFSLEDPAAPRMLNRTNNVFDTYGIFNVELGYSQVVVEYIETEATQTIPCNDNYYGWGCFFDDSNRLHAQRGFFDSSSPNGAAVDNAFAGEFANNADFAVGQDQFVGVGGSLARFTIANQTLYVVNESQLKAFDLSSPATPVEAGMVQLDWGVETIFPAGEELYIGTFTGMHIMDVSTPLSPQRLSTMEHVRSCDPVVVSGDRAYVTLRGGDDCGGFTNQLDVVDISDKRNPQLMNSYPMSGPVGLTVGNSRLFICEPGHGMNILALNEDGLPDGNVTFIEELLLARDVIGLHADQHLITIGEDGIRQLSYDLFDTELATLSTIDVCTGL